MNRLLRFCEFIKEHICKIITAIIIVICVIAVILVIAVINFGIKNAKNAISEGTIVDKDYQSAYFYTTYINSGETMIPQTNYSPESYTFKIKGNKNGEIVECQFEVTKEEYNQYKVGDYYKK